MTRVYRRGELWVLCGTWRGVCVAAALVLILLSACTTPTAPPLPSGGEADPTATERPDVDEPPTATREPATTRAPAEAGDASDESLAPEDFDAFVDQAHIDQIMRDPELVTEYGLSESLGMDNSQLTNLSDAYQLETYDLYAAQRATLLQFDRAALSLDRQLTYDLFLEDLDLHLAGKPYRFHDHPVRQVLGVHTQLLELMTDRQPMRSEKDAGDYVARLEGFPGKTADLVAWLEIQHAQGIVMPKFAINNVIWQLDQFARPAPEKTEVYTVFVDKLAEIDGIDADTRVSLEERALAAVRDQAQPAYRDLKAHFQSIRSDAPEEGGLTSAPDGAAAYAYALRYHTTTDLTAEEIHELGLGEVARIQAEMDDALDALGIPDGALSDRINQVAGRSGSVSGDEILETYAALIEDAGERLAPLFDTVPKSDVVMAAMDYPGAAYYVSPSLDGSRPGTFYAGVGGQAWLFSMPTLTYHEAIPGHHLQLALAQELDHLPTFRRISGYSAYAEGWALYAEQLAWEAGWYEDDAYGNIGRLQAELFRAARLVIDTGIHAQGWTRRQAIDYMVENVGRPEGMAAGEVERYILWPGQATSYKVGMLRLLDLRSQAEVALGDAFDIRDFHSQVLREGSLPLKILEDRLADWVDEG